MIESAALFLLTTLLLFFGWIGEMIRKKEEEE